MRHSSEKIFEEFKKKGKRITKQRKIIIESVLANPEKSCKELYFIAHEKDSTINQATLYRTLATLEELGFIQRKSGITMNDSV